VVVALGETVTLPDVGLVPMPLSIETDVALVVDHVRVEVCPTLIVVGFAERVAVGAGLLPLTVTVACAVTLPPEPDAVMV
jgi:hypothetical protein